MELVKRIIRIVATDCASDGMRRLASSNKKDAQRIMEKGQTTAKYIERLLAVARAFYHYKLGKRLLEVGILECLFCPTPSSMYRFLLQ